MAGIMDTDILAEIAALPGDWHDSGNLSSAAIHRMKQLIDIYFPHGLSASAETGCGKSTLLLSRLSRRHFSFTLAVGDSLQKVKESPLTDVDRITFVEGPSQVTLRNHAWSSKLDFALVDGAHGYPFTDLDYYFIYPQLNHGAIFVLDDIHIPTITNLYRFLLEDDMFENIALEGYTSFFRRTDRPVFDPHGDGWWLQKYNQNRFPHKEWLSPVLGEKWWIADPA